MGNREWIARAGHDPDCGSTIPSATGCAWFSWNDHYGHVNWVAVGDNGVLENPVYLDGRDGSRDFGVLDFGSYSQERQPRAWISADRTQVLAQIFGGATAVGADRFTLPDGPKLQFSKGELCCYWLTGYAPPEGRYELRIRLVGANGQLGRPLDLRGVIAAP